MNKYKIEKNVPMPNACLYPFDEMAVGDSFEIPSDFAKQARNLAGYQKRTHGKKFAVRRCGDNHRVWRIK